MTTISDDLAARLDLLKAIGVIAGWQRGGGPNYGLGRDPLPAKVFPVGNDHANTYYSEDALETDVTIMEHFGTFVRTS